MAPSISASQRDPLSCPYLHDRAGSWGDGLQVRVRPSHIIADRPSGTASARCRCCLRILPAQSVCSTAASPPKGGLRDGNSVELTLTQQTCRSHRAAGIRPVVISTACLCQDQTPIHDRFTGSR